MSILQTQEMMLFFKCMVYFRSEKLLFSLMFRFKVVLLFVLTSFRSQAEETKEKSIGVVGLSKPVFCL